MIGTLKLRKTGNSLGTTFPKSVLQRMQVGDGDTLHAVETRHGLLLTPYDPAFAETMAAADAVIDRNRDALKALAQK